MQKTKGFGLFSVIIIIVITSIVSGITTGVIMLNSGTSNRNQDEILKDENLREFIGVYKTLLEKYYDKIDKEGMLNAAEEGMLNFLGDKYTTYLDNSEYEELIDDLAATYNGVGISILGNVISKVTPDSPASKAGVMVGDIILKVNGIDVTSLNGTSIKSLVKDDKSKSVSLEVKRGEEYLTLEMEKADLINVSIAYNVIPETTIGYLSLTKFSEKLGDQVKDALKEMESEGITSLIIDVRDDVGGYLQAAEDVASLFLEEGKIIYSLESSVAHQDFKDATKEKRDYPIVILTNEETASAAEILTAALKESYDNTTLVGTKTFGKGKVQQVAELSSGDSVKYTTAKWLTPNGAWIDGIGIMPDYEVQITDANVDEQLNTAIDLLK